MLKEYSVTLPNGTQTTMLLDEETAAARGLVETGGAKSRPVPNKQRPARNKSRDVADHSAD